MANPRNDLTLADVVADLPAALTSTDIQPPDRRRGFRDLLDVGRGQGSSPADPGGSRDGPGEIRTRRCHGQALWASVSPVPLRALRPALTCRDGPRVGSTPPHAGTAETMTLSALLLSDGSRQRRTATVTLSR